MTTMLNILSIIQIANVCARKFHVIYEMVGFEKSQKRFSINGKIERNWIDTENTAMGDACSHPSKAMRMPELPPACAIPIYKCHYWLCQQKVTMNFGQYINLFCSHKTALTRSHSEWHRWDKLLGIFRRHYAPSQPNQFSTHTGGWTWVGF